MPRADEFVASFNMWAMAYGIDNKRKIVHYLAQVFHESGCLRYTTELASGAEYDTGPKAIALGNTPEKGWRRSEVQRARLHPADRFGQLQGVQCIRPLHRRRGEEPRLGGRVPIEPDGFDVVLAEERPERAGRQRRRWQNGRRYCQADNQKG